MKTQGHEDSSREIGGEFEDSPYWVGRFKRDASIESFFSLRGRHVTFTRGGRTSIKIALMAARLSASDVVLLPNYLCSCMLAPFHDLSIPYRFYPVDNDLRIDLDGLRRALTTESRAILFIKYFGFDMTDDESAFVLSLKERGVLLIQDASQSWLSCSKRGIALSNMADYSIASFRKTLGIPDGGWLVSQTPHSVPLEPCYDEYVKLRIAAMALKSMYLTSTQGEPSAHLETEDLRIQKATYLSWFRTAETLYDGEKGLPAMSCLSRSILNCIDLATIIRRRRANFRFMLNHWPQTRGIEPVFKYLPTGVCPLGFPIRVAERDVLRNALIQRRIFCPVHWPTPQGVRHPSNSPNHFLSNHMLTIPIDQRYGTRDMARIVRALGELQ